MSLINSSPLLAKGAQMTKKHLAPKSQANLESGLRVYQRILAKTDFNKPIFPITLESAEIFLLAYVKVSHTEMAHKKVTFFGANNLIFLILSI